MSVAVDRSTLHRIFITYASEDSEFVLRLLEELEKYRPPSGYVRLQVQKDEPDFVGTDYYRVVEEHLQQSDLLIVVCSQFARLSEPMQNTVEQFLQKQPSNRLIFVRYADTSSGVINDRETLPQAAASYFDGTFTADFTNLDPDNSELTQIEFEASWYALLSRIYDIRTGDLYAWAEEVQKRTRIRRIATAGAAVLGFLIILGIGEWSRRAAAAEELRKTQLQEAKAIFEISEHAATQSQQLRSFYVGLDAVKHAPDKDKQQFLSKLPGGFVSELQTILPINGEISGAKFNKAEDHLYYWTSNNAFAGYDLNSMEPVFEINEDAEVTGLLMDRRESRLITWGRENNITIRDRDGKTISEEIKHSAAVLGASMNRQEDRLLTWSEDGSAKVWNLTTRKQVGRSMQHKGWMVGASWLANEERVLTWSSDSTARIWNAENGSAISSAISLGGEANNAILLRDQDKMIIVSNANQIHVWNKDGRRVGPTFGHDGWIMGATTTRDEAMLLTWANDHTARLWDLKTGKAKTPPMKHEGWIFGARFDNAEKRILTWSYDNTLRLWNAETGAQIGEVMRHSSGPKGNDSGVFGATFLDGQNAVLSWGDDNTARIWSCENNRQLNPTMQHRYGIENRDVKGALVTLVRNQIITWSNDSTARIWKLNTPIKPLITKTLSESGIGKVRRRFKDKTGTHYDAANQVVQAVSYEEWKK